MSSNIYEDPDFSQNVRYSKGAQNDREDRVERRVDIYESVVNFTSAQADPLWQQGGAHTHNRLPATRRNPVRGFALILGLLCLLLFVGISILFVLYVTVVLREKLLIARFEEQIKNCSSQQRKSYCQFGKENQTEGQTAEWQKVRCSCYYTSREKKNWTESRKDCKGRGAKLLIIRNIEEKELFSKLNYHGESWIGLERVETKDWNTQWKWIDESQPIYTAWKTGVNVNPEVGSKAYIDANGNWMHTKSGLKHWICERMIC
ncbi:uncharacterized protein PAE49_020326 isoform 3-T4 [Odontesthes bonariensis]|uniref:uncharacterized protein LOC142367577 n=1 Tax=Odontesthes bonariensis TaxID=219752 RepID=UPI003F58B013